MRKFNKSEEKESRSSSFDFFNQSAEDNKALTTKVNHAALIKRRVSQQNKYKEILQKKEL